jgi:hypothetical protein
VDGRALRDSDWYTPGDKAGAIPSKPSWPTRGLHVKADSPDLNRQVRGCAISEPAGPRLMFQPPIGIIQMQRLEIRRHWGPTVSLRSRESVPSQLGCGSVHHLYSELGTIIVPVTTALGMATRTGCIEASNKTG